MSQTAKAQEPSMEEILASIRRIIADDETAKPAAKAPDARPTPVAVAPARPVTPAQRPAAAASKQDEIDAMLADVETAKPAVKSPPPKPASPGSDVLDLTEAMAAPAAPSVPPTFKTIDGVSDVVFTERQAETHEPATQPSPQAPAVDRGLMSPSTRAAVDSAFNSLAHTVLGQNARTLEDLVKEMLRPLLKTWLDDNLPSLVERIVRDEIERVSRGRH